MKKGRILSGMQPTGKLHLGNYFGALINWVALQDEYECFYMVADLHALTSDYEDTKDISKNIQDVVIDWLSCGLSPEKSVIFVQSDVAEHSQLHLLLSMITPLGWLERVPTYKSKMLELEGKKNISTYGFLGYPVLQAADILLYKADTVPVGEDQLPHLEITREITRRFNYLYGNVFPEPQAKLTQTPKIIGIDGRKMSKSYENCIYISDKPEVVSKKVMKMITDPEKIKLTDKGHPEVCSVFYLHQIYSKTEIKDIEVSCKNAKLGCVECKKNLSNKINSQMSNILVKREDFLKNKDIIEDILSDGAKKAKRVAEKTLQEVKEAMKIRRKDGI